MAQRYGLPFEIAKTDVRSLAKTEKLSIETAARLARHRFFDEAGRDHRCRQVILGHHADDRVETVLINLFRGSGKLTLPKSPSEIRIGRRRLNLIRPLYPVWRCEIDSYIEANGLTFREDPTNAKTDVIRNRLRHQLVPLLEDIFARDTTKIINRAALIASEEDQFLQSQLGALDLEPENQPGTLSTTRLTALPLALQRRAVHDWLTRHQIPKISFEKVEECLTLLDPQSGPAKINLPGDHHARRRNKILFID
jgi:tRNA(Ile)-lysidine synthase